MGKNIIFKVYDKSGKDVTIYFEWYIDSEGDLYYMTDDVDMPLHPVYDEFYYEVELQ